jgi:ElaA protein
MINCKQFQELNSKELYAILQLRSEVFVVEQQCIFLDMDDIDVACHHLCLWKNEKLVAYARIVPPQFIYQDRSSIGRVVTAPDYRTLGLGKEIVASAIIQTRCLYPTSNIQIGAQLYLKQFYESFGFRQCGFLYLEDGIEHIPMSLIFRD